MIGYHIPIKRVHITLEELTVATVVPETGEKTNVKQHDKKQNNNIVAFPPAFLKATKHPDQRGYSLLGKGLVSARALVDRLCSGASFRLKPYQSDIDSVLLPRTAWGTVADGPDRLFNTVTSEFADRFGPLFISPSPKSWRLGSEILFLNQTKSACRSRSADTFRLVLAAAKKCPCVKQTASQCLGSSFNTSCCPGGITSFVERETGHPLHTHTTTQHQKAPVTPEIEEAAPFRLRHPLMPKDKHC